MRTLLFAAIVAVLYLAGCAPTSMSIYRGGEPKGDSPAGYVVVSIAKPENLEYFFTYHLEFREVTTGKTGVLSLTAPNMPSPKYDFEASGLQGAVISQRLPPGRYEIYNYTLKQPYEEWSAKKDFSIPFEIKTGEVSYIGAYDGTAVWGRNFLGLKTIDAFYWRLSDKSDRDIPIARRLEPGLAQMTVTLIVPDPKRLGIPGITGTAAQ